VNAILDIKVADSCVLMSMNAPQVHAMIMPHALTKTVIIAVNVMLDSTVTVSLVPMSTNVIIHHVTLTLPVQMNLVHSHVLVTLDLVE